jgi:hypothetical protein
LAPGAGAHRNALTIELLAPAAHLFVTARVAEALFILAGQKAAHAIVLPIKSRNSSSGLGVYAIPRQTVSRSFQPAGHSLSADNQIAKRCLAHLRKRMIGDDDIDGEIAAFVVNSHGLIRSLSVKRPMA